MGLGTGSQPQVFASPSARRRFVIHAVAVLLALSGLSVFAYMELEFLFDASEARSFVAGFGTLAPAVLVTLQAAQVLLAPIPGQVLGVVVGYLYGPWLGTGLNVLGVAIGSTVAFWLARRYGRTYLERFVHDDLVSRFDGISDRRAAVTLFVVFLVPGLPDDLLCFAGGLTTLPLRTLVLIAVVGRAPGFFLANVFGELVAAGQMVTATVLFVLVLVATGLCFLFRHRLLASLAREH